jgi:hypothetical protein
MPHLLNSSSCVSIKVHQTEWQTPITPSKYFKASMRQVLNHACLPRGHCTALSSRLLAITACNAKDNKVCPPPPHKRPGHNHKTTLSCPHTPCTYGAYLGCVRERAPGMGQACCDLVYVAPEATPSPLRRVCTPASSLTAPSSRAHCNSSRSKSTLKSAC